MTDPLLVGQDRVTRINWPSALLGPVPRTGSRTSRDDGVPDALIAEPGFSGLVQLRKGGRERTLSFDSSVSPSGSHGHWDHVSGMERLVRSLGGVQLPVMIHPEFWNRPRIWFAGFEPAKLPATSRQALEGVGFQIVEERQLSFLLGQSALTTGEVDRTTEFETGFQGHEALRGPQVAGRPADRGRSGARRPRS